MSYKLSSVTDTDSTSINFIDVGIHDNIKLDRVVKEVSPNGNPYLAFYFKDEEGKEANLTEWPPRGDNEEELNKKRTNQMLRIKHIAKRFVDEEEIDKIDVNTFEEFSDAIIKLLHNKTENVLLRLKVVYGDKGFTSVPKYRPFIESMDIPKEKSKLSILSIDKMTKDVPDRERRVVNPFSETPSTILENNTEDIPQNKYPDKTGHSNEDANDLPF